MVYYEYPRVVSSKQLGFRRENGAKRNCPDRYQSSEPMNPTVKIFVVAVVGVIAFDALASVASRVTGLPYSIMSVGTFVIYFATGFYATRHANLKIGLCASAIVGFADSTFGWFISWVIRPGGPAEQVIALGGIAVTILSVILIATVGGALGGLFSRILPSIKNSPT